MLERALGSLTLQRRAVKQRSETVELGVGTRCMLVASDRGLLPRMLGLETPVHIDWDADMMRKSRYLAEV